MREVYSSIQEQKIGRYSVLEMHIDYILLKIKKPAWPYLACLVVSPLVFLFLYYWADVSDPQVLQDLIICFAVLYLLQIAMAFYFGRLEDHYEMNMYKHAVYMQRYFTGRLMKEQETKWKADSLLSCEVIYESYNSVSEVWLVAFHKESKEKVRLLNFYDIAAFDAFKTIFEKKYPDKKIGEWHE
jgi:hypothetical protein